MKHLRRFLFIEDVRPCPDTLAPEWRELHDCWLRSSRGWASNAAVALGALVGWLAISFAIWWGLIGVAASIWLLVTAFGRHTWCRGRADAIAFYEPEASTPREIA